MKTGNLLNEKVKELEEKLTRVNLIIYATQRSRVRGVYNRNFKEYKTYLEKWVNEKNLIESELKLIRSKNMGVYKVISYKHNEEGEVIDVVVSEDQLNGYEKYEVEEVDLRELDTEELYKCMESALKLLVYKELCFEDVLKGLRSGKKAYRKSWMSDWEAIWMEKGKLFWYINPKLDKEEIVALPVEFVSAKDWEFVENAKFD